MHLLDSEERLDGRVVNVDQLNLTALRNKWCERDCLISDFLQYLVGYQDVPGPIPGEPVVTDSGNNWLSLAWNKPAHSGAAPVVAYKIDAWLRGGEGARWTELGISPLNTFDAFNLKPDGEYKFRITPRNRYGWGESIQSSPIFIRKLEEFPEFSKVLPGQLKVLQGTDLHLECQTRTDDSLRIRWFRDSSEISPEDDSRYLITSEGGICSLTISRVNEGDAGRYTCEATNRAGRASTFARIFTVTDPKILDADKNLRMTIENFDNISELPPNFTMRLRDRRVEISHPVRLTCQVSGRPEPTIKWFKNDEELKQNSHFIFWTEENFRTLEINKTNLEDSGVYCIVAENQHGSVSCRCNLIVDKGIRDYITPVFLTNLEPSELKIKEGSELHLVGKIEAYPTVGITWYRNGDRLRPSRKTVTTLSYDGRVELTVAPVGKRDGGVYTCVASNEVGRTESTASVEILAKETSASTEALGSTDKTIPYSKEPKFLKKPRSFEAFEGDNVTILCEVIGDPKPEVVWLRDFLKPEYYKNASEFHREGDGPVYRLEIPSVKLDFTGTYTVYAKNCHGDAKAIISLQVKVKDLQSKQIATKTIVGTVQMVPSVQQELKDLRCCDGDSIVFECRIEGVTPYDIRWECNNQLIQLGEDYRTEIDGDRVRLLINRVYPEDEGEYVCIAHNDLGRASTSACLIVDIPEEKECLLKEQLIYPKNLPAPSPSRHISTRSISPAPRYREAISRGYRPYTIRATAPKFYAIPHNRVAEEGETVKFQCAVAGHPDPWVTWDKDGAVITSTARLTITECDDLRILEIKDVKSRDSGIYRIILENDVGRVEASARLEVISHRPAISRGLRARSLSPRPGSSYSKDFLTSSTRYGSNARLFYDLHSVPTPFLKYYKNECPVCDAEANQVVSKEPKIVKNLAKVLSFTEGSFVKLDVMVVGIEPFDVIWFKDNCVLPEHCQVFRQQDHGNGCFSLTLPEALTEHSGCYRCEIYNIYGEASTNCQLNIVDLSEEAAVKFVKLPSPVIASLGKNVSFCVKLHNSSGENIEVSWEVGGVSVVNCDRFRVEEDGDVKFLHVTGVTYLDSGQVKCTAATKHSRSTSHVKRTVVVSCCTELVIVTDVDNIGSFGVDSASETSMEAVNQVPSGVNDVKLISSRINEPALLLRRPQDTTALVGDQILLKATYIGHPEPTVRWTRAGRELKNNDRLNITSGEGVSCLILQNITADDSGKYDVWVENRFGADSTYASVSVEGPPDPPSGKPNVSSDLERVTVAWSSSPYDGGKIVTGFALEHSIVGSGIWTTVTENCYSLSYTFGGLRPGRSYVFRVRALNIHGYSTPGLESDAFRMEEKSIDLTDFYEPKTVLIEPGTEFKSRFEVLEELGKGRFGVVNKVIDKTTSHTLAAKFIRCRTSKDKIKVQEEIDIMNLLRHPNILQLIGAFELAKEIVMVVEYVSGGELFERVVADDFTLTEKDCISFLRQICEGAAYMHTQNIIHLDLKPENIMCHTRTSHEIKIIDFGLAQRLTPNSPVRVLFGTPEFIPPEIINYEPVGTASDMWSIGVITYVLLSGLSPFMGDNDAETFANITRANYDFEDEAFSNVSENARSFIGSLLLKKKEDRLSAEQCLKHIWLDPNSHKETVVLSTDKLKKFIIRRKWQTRLPIRRTA